jgi:hypothetical protein
LCIGVVQDLGKLDPIAGHRGRGRVETPCDLTTGRAQFDRHAGALSWGFLARLSVRGIP